MFRLFFAFPSYIYFVLKMELNCFAEKESVILLLSQFRNTDHLGVRLNYQPVLSAHPSLNILNVHRYELTTQETTCIVLSFLSCDWIITLYPKGSLWFHWDLICFYNSVIVICIFCSFVLLLSIYAVLLFFKERDHRLLATAINATISVLRLLSEYSEAIYNSLRPKKWYSPLPTLRSQKPLERRSRVKAWIIQCVKQPLLFLHQ